MNTVVQLRTSQSEKPTVGGRDKNAAYRKREYLTEGEIAKLLDSASDSRGPAADPHGLPARAAGLRAG